MRIVGLFLCLTFGPQLLTPDSLLQMWTAGRPVGQMCSMRPGPSKMFLLLVIQQNHIVRWRVYRGTMNLTGKPEQHEENPTTKGPVSDPGIQPTTLPPCRPQASWHDVLGAWTVPPAVPKGQDTSL